VAVDGCSAAGVTPDGCSCTGAAASDGCCTGGVALDGCCTGGLVEAVVPTSCAANDTAKENAAKREHVLVARATCLVKLRRIIPLLNLNSILVEHLLQFLGSPVLQQR
jgi:hypothetical protein